MMIDSGTRDHAAGLETSRPEARVDSPSTGPPSSIPLILSFDVEEHHLIEAAAGLVIDQELQERYRGRMRETTEWLLGRLADWQIRATFFIVGRIARTEPDLVRAIHEAGHEVASHGWDHRRVLVMDTAGFREDLRKSKDALEQVIGASVVGYRAPTFSIVRQTAWALDVLAELDFLYDSSIYPVHHDRYGIPDAPRSPFLALGSRHEILELPPATLRMGGVNFPIGGGGYFRLLPSPLMRAALACSRRDASCGASVLYFHPWEFDPDQPRLPLRRFSRFRTYVGIRRSRVRLHRLMACHRVTRAVDLARALSERREELPRFCPSA